MVYPYLGAKQIDGKYVVVFFTNPGIGVVVHSDVEDTKYKFGKNASFNEDEFEFLPEEQAVTLTN